MNLAIDLTHPVCSALSQNRSIVGLRKKRFAVPGQLYMTSRHYLPTLKSLNIIYLQYVYAYFICFSPNSAYVCAFQFQITLKSWLIFTLIALSMLTNSPEFLHNITIFHHFIENHLKISQFNPVCLRRVLTIYSKCHWITISHLFT